MHPASAIPPHRPLQTLLTKQLAEVAAQKRLLRKVTQVMNQRLEVQLQLLQVDKKSGSDMSRRRWQELQEELKAKNVQLADLHSQMQLISKGGDTSLTVRASVSNNTDGEPAPMGGQRDSSFAEALQAELGAMRQSYTEKLQQAHSQVPLLLPHTARTLTGTEAQHGVCCVFTLSRLLRPSYMQM